MVQQIASPTETRISSGLNALSMQVVILLEIGKTSSNSKEQRNHGAEATLRWLLDAEEAGLLKYNVTSVDSGARWDDEWAVYIT